MEAGGEGTPRDDAPATGAVLAALWEDLQGLVGDHVLLFALELRLLRQTAARLVVVMLLAGTLLATAWLVLWALLVALMLEAGASAAVALLVVLAINLVGGWLALRHAGTLVERLALPATVRRLSFAPPPATPETAP